MEGGSEKGRTGRKGVRGGTAPPPGSARAPQAGTAPDPAGYFKGGGVVGGPKRQRPSSELQSLHSHTRAAGSR